MPESLSNKRQYSAPALSKGLDILELMSGEQPEGLTLKQIADKLERQKSEIFRMLVVLEQRGYISVDPESDKYSITMKLLDLAHKHPDINRIGALATPIMEILSNVTEQSCHLVIRRAAHGIVIVQKDSPSDLRFGVRLGAKIPLQNTCSGHILIAFAAPSTQEYIYKNTPAKQRPLKKHFHDAIDRVSKQGFETLKSQQIQGVKDIGFPVYDYTGNVVAALVIPFLAHLDNSHTIDYGKTEELLKNAATNLSIAMGYTFST